MKLDGVLTGEARELVALLSAKFAPVWAELAAERTLRQAAFRQGELPALSPATRAIRESDWQVAAPPDDLRDRRVEIVVAANETGELHRAMQSGAQVLIADFDDLFAPTWSNVIRGHGNLPDLVRSRQMALVVRPRGWHMVEAHMRVDGSPVLAGLFDAGVYMARCARPLLETGSGPYFYLPKLESHQEARLWQAVFREAELALGLPRGAVRASVQIETLTAAYEMDEILYELRDSVTALNAGRWDYLFNLVKRVGHRPEALLPPRESLTMAPFLEAYAERLVRTAHRRGARAIGGTSNLVPDLSDPAATAQVLGRVRAEKEREARAGYDGGWVAHPALVAPARAAFDRESGGQHRECPPPEALLDLRAPGGGLVTVEAVRENIATALLYLSAWLEGRGTIIRRGVMEETATAELARAQLWQWLRHGVRLENGRPLSPALYRSLCDSLGQIPDRVREILDQLVLAGQCPEFFPDLAYRDLIGGAHP